MTMQILKKGGGGNESHAPSCGTVALMVLGQFRKLAKDHKGYGSAATMPHAPVNRIFNKTRTLTSCFCISLVLESLSRRKVGQYN